MTDASLDELRSWVGARSTNDDALLSRCLQVAGEYVRDRIYPDRWNRSDVQQAVVMIAAKLYRTRQTAEQGGMSDGGQIIVRPSTISGDGNVRALLADHLDMRRVGIA